MMIHTHQSVLSESPDVLLACNVVPAAELKQQLGQAHQEHEAAEQRHQTEMKSLSQQITAARTAAKSSARKQEDEIQAMKQKLADAQLQGVNKIELQRTLENAQVSLTVSDV